MPNHLSAQSETGSASNSMPTTTAKLLLKMTKPYAFKLVVFFFLTFVGILAWTASPLVIARVVTDLGKSHVVNGAIWRLVVLYGLLRAADEIFWRLGELLMRSFKPQMVESVRSLLFKATLKRPYSFFVNSSSGRIGHWINQTTSTVNDFVDTTIWNVWGRTISLIASAIFLFFAHWSLAVIFIIWLILLFWYNVERGKRFGELVALQSDETSKASGVVVDAISNHLSVRVFGAQHREQKLLAGQQQEIIRRWRDSWWQNLVTNTVKGQSATLASVIAFALIVILYGHGIVQLGDIVLFIAFFGDASSSLWQLAWALDAYYRHFGTIQNALDGLSGDEERRVATHAKLTQPKKVTLELDDVTFSYPDQSERPILKSLQLKIKAGEKVGVVGHSGAGKSTLVALLLGFYEPTSGQLLVNDESFADRDPSFIRSFCSYVPQDTNLFNRTVAENVKYARPDASEKDIMIALAQAQADDFVKLLPEGLDTIIGERGVKLSGGQRQRIAIARAVLQDAPLLLLDEATSALDSVSEQAIQKALHGLMQNKTSIVIAHRLSTLKHLDTIIVLDKGEIAESGSHEQLLRQKGIYADLWKRQKDGFIID